nr:redoxin family protein [Nocardia nova]
MPGARSRTAQACDFRNHHQDLRAAGAQRIYGLSSQSTIYQAEVVNRLRLPFAMLSATGLRLAATLSAPTVEVDGTTLCKRMTLIVREQTIEHVFYPMFPPDQHAAEVLRWLQRNPD